MTDILMPMEMGFAEFTAGLISEVFDAVANSQAEQEQRLTEITDAATLPLEEFAEKFISDEQVDTELARLFPTTELNHPHLIYTKAPYTPKSADTPESPAFESTFGVLLKRKDYQVSKTKEVFLKRSGVNTVRQMARLSLAEIRLAVLRALVKQGIPRVIVDSGRVNAKLTFQVTRIESIKKTITQERLAVPLRKLNHLPGIPLPADLKQVRLIVRQADDQSPKTSQMQVNIFGEVEITFKTIS